MFILLCPQEKLSMDIQYTHSLQKKQEVTMAANLVASLIAEACPLPVIE